MKYNKNLFNIKNIKNSRQDDIINSSEQYIKYINKFVSQQKFQNYLSHFFRYTGIPNNVLSQYTKSIIAGRINFYNNSQAFPRTRLFSILVEIPKFFAFVTIIFFFRNKKTNINSKFKYDLMIDKIENINDLLRFKKLINLYNKEKVIVINSSKNNFSLKGVKIVKKIPLHNYNLKIYDLFVIFQFFFNSLKYSLIFSENLLYYTISILNSYYYYNSIFSEVMAKDCIIFQHYHTNSIKNFLFKNYGGRNSCAIQKNIPKLGRSSFFYDADVFFSYNKIFSDQFLKCGSIFKKNIPIGSFFYENYIANFDKKILQKKYDIILIGGNGFYKNGPDDIYENQMLDYIEHLKWFKKLSNNFKSLSFAFCPHSSFKKEDSIEYQYLSGGNIEFCYENIYNLSSSSKINLSWCSSVILEIKGENENSYFLDPYMNNRQFLDNSSKWNNYRISNYEKLEKLVNEIAIENNSLCHVSDSSDFTFQSAEASNIIYNTLTNYVD